MMTHRRVVPVVMFALLASVTSMLRAAEVAGVDVRSNLTYYSGEGADKYRHRLDLYMPKGRRDVPVMLFVHGGGFTVGIKDQYAFVGQVFAADGIATAVISYRLSPKTSYPGHVQDVARAFAWLRAHVAERFDVEMIGADGPHDRRLRFEEIGRQRVPLDGRQLIHPSDMPGIEDQLAVAPVSLVL